MLTIAIKEGLIEKVENFSEMIIKTFLEKNGWDLYKTKIIKIKRTYEDIGELLIINDKEFKIIGKEQRKMLLKEAYKKFSPEKIAMPQQWAYFAAKQKS